MKALSRIFKRSDPKQAMEAAVQAVNPGAVSTRGVPPGKEAFNLPPIQFDAADLAILFEMAKSSFDQCERAYRHARDAAYDAGEALSRARRNLEWIEHEINSHCEKAEAAALANAVADVDPDADPHEGGGVGA